MENQEENPQPSNLETKSPATAEPPTDLSSDPPAAALISGNDTPPLLPCAPLAYENASFLNSADGRLIRIVSEYLEPLARFRHEQIHDTVVFFGSARFRGREEADHALELLDNTGSAPRPRSEQPASPPQIVREGYGVAAKARRGSRGNGPLLRGCATPGADAHRMDQADSLPASPFCGHLRRWPRNHGSRQPRRIRGRRQNHRAQHPSAF